MNYIRMGVVSFGGRVKTRHIEHLKVDTPIKKDIKLQVYVHVMHLKSISITIQIPLKTVRNAKGLDDLKTNVAVQIDKYYFQMLTCATVLDDF